MLVLIRKSDNKVLSIAPWFKRVIDRHLYYFEYWDKKRGLRGTLKVSNARLLTLKQFKEEHTAF